MVRFCLLLSLLLSGSVLADDKPKQLICSLGDFSECHSSGCEGVKAEEIDAPKILNINVKKKKIQAIRGATGTTRKIDSVEVTNEYIILQSAGANNQESFGFTATISLQSGNLTFAAAGDDIAFTAFGACVRND